MKNRGRHAAPGPADRVFSSSTAAPWDSTEVLDAVAEAPSAHHVARRKLLNLSGKTAAVLASALVLATLAASTLVTGKGAGIAVIVEAILSFVGLSIASDTPTWGGMIAEGRQIVHQAWWVLAAPLALLFATVLAFNQLGDGLRRALDPVLRR